MGNVRAVISDVRQATVSANSVTFATDVKSFTDYYAFGWAMPGRNFSAGEYRYGFNGKESAPELYGEGAAYDFGARIYDGRIVKFTSIDRYSFKAPGVSPYSFAGNSPINAVDINGDSLYILFYVSGNKKGDDLFKAAALTRQYDIENSSHFDPKRDKVVVLSVSDLSDIKEKVSATVAQFKEQAGNTVEFGMWSHSGLDGPIGSESTSSCPLERVQMAPCGWEEIDFNWDKGEPCRAVFYGCNTGNPVGEPSFAVTISKLENFEDVRVKGQLSSAFPSEYTDVRSITFAHLMGDYLPIKSEGAVSVGMNMAVYSVIQKTYLVAGYPDQSSDAYFGSAKANKMQVAINGVVVGAEYQSGDKKVEKK